MKTPSRVALGTGVALAALAPAIASHSWSTYHWASDGKGVELTVNLAITSQWNAAVNGGIADWERSRKLSFTTQSAGDVRTKQCNPILGELLVCNDAYGRRGWLGIATIWLSDGHIVQATTQLNDSYHNNPPYNSAAWRSLVACQEVAHDFGLDHQDEAFNNFNLGTCMDYTSAPSGGVLNGFNYGPSNEHPNDHDYDQILLIYDHDDGVSGASATDFGVREVGKPAAPAAGRIDSSPPGLSAAEWGRAVRFDRLGRPNVFEKSLGPGQKRITHVFWALETRKGDIR